jgi:hypothetical protein
MHIYISIITVLMKVWPDAAVDAGVAPELAGTKAPPPLLSVLLSRFHLVPEAVGLGNTLRTAATQGTEGRGVPN